MTTWVESLVAECAELGSRGLVVLEAALSEVPAHELAALGYDFAGTFARPNQVVPQGDWRSFGAVAGRGFGKTVTVGSFAVDEVAAGRARRLALVGQSEAKTIEILVEGETGILALTPPWVGAEWQPSSNRIVFGNGATATVYTPQEPSGLRGPQHDLAIATEVCAWPAATRDEALSNLELGLRLGYGKLLWETTPRRRNPILRRLVERSKKSPARHIIVGGSTRENALNLSDGAVAEWEEAWAGTARGREELEGIFADDVDDALFKEAWITKSRRGQPERFKRRIISVDPSITNNAKYSDATGIVCMGLGLDDQVYALKNLTGAHRPEVWPLMVVDEYIATRCDCIVIDPSVGFRGVEKLAEALRSGMSVGNSRGRELEFARFLRGVGNGGRI